jgi:hypothetical protein
VALGAARPIRAADKFWQDFFKNGWYFSLIFTYYAAIFLMNHQKSMKGKNRVLRAEEGVSCCCVCIGLQ